MTSYIVYLEEKNANEATVKIINDYSSSHAEALGHLEVGHLIRLLQI